MSIEAMSWVYKHSEARLADRLVLLAIADEADDDGTNAYPSQRRIADKARLGQSTVRRSIENLERLGELAVERPEKTGRGHFNRYRVLMRDLSEGARSEHLLWAEFLESDAAVAEKRAETRRNAPLSGANPQTPIPIDQDQDLAPAKPTRKRDPHWDALVACWSLDERELAPAERGRLNQAAKVLRDLDADPAEIPARRAMYAMLFPSAAQTPLALVNRWAECRPDPARLPPSVSRSTPAIVRALARANAEEAR